MRTGDKKGFVWILICMFLILCTGCSGDTEEKTNNNSEGVESMVIFTKEDAKDAIEKYLQETYDVEYTVPTPIRNEDGDFQVTAYRTEDADDKLLLVIDVVTGECRDDSCLATVEAYLEEKLQAEADKLWDNADIQIQCTFGNDVPSEAWSKDADPQNIILAEHVQCILLFTDVEESVDVTKEAEKLQMLVALECLQGVHVDFQGYYVKLDGDTQQELNTVFFYKLLNKENVSQEEIIGGFTRQ